MTGRLPPIECPRAPALAAILSTPSGAARTGRSPPIERSHTGARGHAVHALGSRAMTERLPPIECPRAPALAATLSTLSGAAP